MPASRSSLEQAGKPFRTEGISERVKSIVMSPIKEMELLAHETGGAVSLGQGIPSFRTPLHIREAAIAAIRSGLAGKYSLNPGLPELREAVSKKLRTHNHITADPAREVFITAGAMEALAASLLATINPGDEVLLTTPCYSSHIEQVLLAGGQPVFVPLIEEEGWRLDPDAMRKAVTPRTKLLLLNSPLNPTGSVFPKTDLLHLGDLALEHSLLILTDETYEHLIYDGSHFSLASREELAQHTLSCFSFSKSYAMTGYRVGYLVAEEGIINQILKIHDAFIICAPVVSQHAALAALAGGDACVSYFRQEFKKRRALIIKRLSELGVFRFQEPRGAYYIFPQVEGMHDSFSFCLRLLREAKVTTIPGRAFGPTGEGHIRMSFASSPATITAAFDRLSSFFRSPAGTALLQEKRTAETTPAFPGHTP